MEALARVPPPENAEALQRRLDAHANWRAYGLALSSVGIALLMRAALHPSLGSALPFATVFVAVTVTAWLGGRGPALVAMGLGYVAGQFFFARSPAEPQPALSPF